MMDVRAGGVARDERVWPRRHSRHPWHRHGAGSPNLSGPGTASAAARNYLNCLNTRCPASTSMPAASWWAALSRAIRKRCVADEPAVKGSTKIPAGMTISTFESDDLAGMADAEQARSCGGDPAGDWVSGIADQGIKRSDIGGAAVRVPPRRR